MQCNYRLFQKLIATLEAENPGVKVNWVDVPVSDGNQNLNSCFRENGTDVVNLNPDLPPS